MLLALLPYIIYQYNILHWQTVFKTREIINTSSEMTIFYVTRFIVRYQSIVYNISRGGHARLRLDTKRSHFTT